MNKTNAFMAFLLTAGALAASAGGCELIASDDRSLIPGGGSSSTGGTASSTSSSSSSSSGSSCPRSTMACTSASTCAAQTTVCLTSTCADGCCGTANAASGAHCTDSGGSVCDGSGHCVACLAPTDCGGTCQACTATLTGGSDGTCGNITAGKPAPAGQCAVTTTCGNDGNCAAGGVCEQAAATVACGSASCASGTLTAAATCGGGNCNAGATSSCGAYDCNAGHTACLTQCGSGSDCASSATYCANPGASGICAAKLGNGATCGWADQCTSGWCYGTPNICQANSCGDGIQDGTETDVDCGGGTCPRCPVGEKCLMDTDCVASVCDADSLTCVASQCTDHRKDGNETDVDCGGGTCPQCPNTEDCLVAIDCQSGSCAGGVCTPCSSDAQCSGATPACNTTTGACEQCSATNSTACTGATAFCDTTINTCVQCTQDSQCTTPPGNGCADATHVYAAACTSDACSYSAGSACSNGCYQDVCNSTGPTYDGSATGLASGVLDLEQNLDSSNGFEAASTPITVDVYLTPHNAVLSVTLTYTTDNFTTTTPIACTLSGTSGGDDVWTATIPGQPSGTTVRFYYDSVPYNGTGDIFSPGNNFNYTYVAQ